MTRALAVLLTPSSSAEPAPASRPSARKNVLPHMFDLQVLDKEYPHLPDKVLINHAGETLTVMYYVTVGTDGHVTAVDPVTSASQAEARRAVADVDAVVEETLRRWKFRPQVMPIRSMMRFVFTINRARFQ